MNRVFPHGSSGPRRRPGVLAVVGLLLALASPGAAQRAFVLVRGADGETAYGEKFTHQLQAWREALKPAGADCFVIGEKPLPEGTTDAAALQQQLAALPRETADELWLVLMGHGSWDGAEARFNLRGPDVSATDLATWLHPFQRPLVIINTSSASGPFLAKLSGPQRVVVTATRGGNEKNYARFGEELAAALTDPAADFDQDGQLSVLEMTLAAAHRTEAFYKEEGRLATEHALLDDNGDGLGTPAAWFRGLRSTKQGQGEVDGFRAHQRVLLPSASDAALTAEQKAERETLETQLATLRSRKATMAEEAYFQELEGLLLQLAKAQGL